MSTTTAGIVFALSLLIALALAHRPMGDYMYRVFTSPRHLRLERVAYRLIGVNPDGEQAWGAYVRSVLAFSAVSVLFLYAFERLQHHLLLSLGFDGVAPDLAWNTAASFTTNTNWQAYSGESTMSYFTQMAGLAYHNFVSAAVGISVAIAFIRGIARREMQTIGNFWVDMTRAKLWVLLPICMVGALVLVASGVPQNLRPYHTAQLVEKQTIEIDKKDVAGNVITNPDG